MWRYLIMKEIEKYLKDLDNLVDTGRFNDELVTDYTFHHKEMSLKDFVLKGREFIRLHLMEQKETKPNAT